MLCVLDVLPGRAHGDITERDKTRSPLLIRAELSLLGQDIQLLPGQPVCSFPSRVPLLWLLCDLSVVLLAQTGQFVLLQRQSQPRPMQTSVLQLWGTCQDNSFTCKMRCAGSPGWAQLSKDKAHQAPDTLIPESFLSVVTYLRDFSVFCSVGTQINNKFQYKVHWWTFATPIPFPCSTTRKLKRLS